MGPKFVIVFSGVDVEGATGFLQDLKAGIENLKIKIVDNNDEESEEDTIMPKINMVLTTYYKGTALESFNKKLEEYLDNADKNENDINEI